MEPIKIYRNRSEPNYFVIDWMLHDRCTYNCSYCPPANKSGTDSWLDLKKLDEFCTAVEQHAHSIDPKFQIHVLFTGGEPTVWKDFDKLIKRITDRGWFTTVNSNGSRTSRWWDEYAKNFIQILLSYHTESVDDNEFIEKIKICEKYTNTSINIMLNPDPKYFSRAIEIGNRIRRETKYVSFTYHKIQHTFGLQEISVPHYTPEQINVINSLDNYPNLSDRYPYLPNNFYVQSADLNVKQLDAIELINAGHINFKGWQCYAGLESIFVDSRGDIFRATCRAGESMGSILNPADIVWTKNSIECPHTWCRCVTDIRNTKVKDVL